MGDDSNLEIVCSVLADPPFSKKYTVLELCYSIEAAEYLSIVYAFSNAIIGSNGKPLGKQSSIPNIWEIDVRSIAPEAGIASLVDFLSILSFKSDGIVLSELFAHLFSAALNESELGSSDRDGVLGILTFLSKDLATHCKRFRLATFLRPIVLPSEFQEDEAVSQRLAHLKALQHEFAELDKQTEQARETQSGALDLKVAIRQLELEKQQVSLKISSEQAKVQSIPQFEAWLLAVKRFRDASTSRQQAQELWTEHEQQASDLATKVAKQQELLNKLQSSSNSASALKSLEADLRVKKRIDERMSELQAQFDTLAADIAKKKKMLDKHITSEGSSIAEDAFTEYIQEQRVLNQQYKAKAIEFKAAKAAKQELLDELQALQEQERDYGKESSLLTIDDRVNDLLENKTLTDIENELKQAVKTYNTKQALVAKLNADCSKLAAKLKKAKLLEDDKKKWLDSNAINLDADVQQLEQKLDIVNKEIASEQTLLFLAHERLQNIEQQIQQVEEEENIYKGKIDTKTSLVQKDRGFRTHQQFLTKAISEAESSLKHEQSRYENDKKQMQAGFKQIDYFKGLAKILKVKTTLQEASLKHMKSSSPLPSSGPANSSKGNLLIS